MVIHSFNTLKRNLKKDFSGFKKIKIAVLGDTATQLFVQALKGYGFENKIDFEIFEADYSQIELQAFDPASEVYSFKPEFTILFFSAVKLQKKFAGLILSERNDFADQQLSKFELLYNTLLNGTNSKIIFFNFQEVNESVFGNFANKTAFSFTYQLRKINYGLMNLSQRNKNLFVVDLNIQQSQYGASYVTDRNIFINTELLFSLDFLPVIAKNTADVILAITGKFNKCLIIDLDNTIWGGVIGDDGIENIQIGELGIGKAFTELQLWIKQLKQRGIILAVCSKNDETIAKEPFIKHPDMILRLEDIAVFTANWNNKADNIRYIQSVLNIGFDSMVFIDDNPFERHLVGNEIPEVCVPELPEDPADYLSYLQKLNLFETASFTGEDELRTLQYQEEAKRTAVQKQFTNEDDFLSSLEMVSKTEPFNSFNIPRVAQLIQRSNQFNLRTIRYTENEIQNISLNKNYSSFAFWLKDKFGEYGLISVIILKQKADILFIDTWIMSCRVLKRGMENFVLNTITNAAKELNAQKLIGEYLPTAKNGLVKNHYAGLGFKLKGSFWELDLSNYSEKKCYIKKENKL